MNRKLPLILAGTAAAVLCGLAMWGSFQKNSGSSEAGKGAGERERETEYRVERAGSGKIFDGDAVLYSIKLMDTGGQVVKEGRGWQMVRKLVGPTRELVKKLGVGGEGEFVAPYEKYIPSGTVGFLKQGEPVRARVKVEEKIHGKFLRKSEGKQANFLVIDVAGRGGVDALGTGGWKKKTKTEKWINSRACRRFSADGGQADMWEWIGPSSGFLVVESPELQKKAEGKTGGYILDGTDLVGGFTGGQPWKSSYQVLGQFDKNGNGVVDGEELEGLGFWADLNINARVEDGELRGAEEVFSAIGVRAEEAEDGSAFSPKDGAVLKDGRAVGSWDWWSRGETSGAD
jgi:hypothetical protein